MKIQTGKAYYIQCKTWRDKKQVCFLSPNEVVYTEGLTVKRHGKKKNIRVNIAGPFAQRNYVTYFNAVDKNDHNSSFCLTTIRKIHYYLRIFFLGTGPCCSLSLCCSMLSCQTGYW